MYITGSLVPDTGFRRRNQVVLMSWRYCKHSGISTFRCYSRQKLGMTLLKVELLLFLWPNTWLSPSISLSHIHLTLPFSLGPWPKSQYFSTRLSKNNKKNFHISILANEEKSFLNFWSWTIMKMKSHNIIETLQMFKNNAHVS